MCAGTAECGRHHWHRASECTMCCTALHFPDSAALCSTVLNPCFTSPCITAQRTAESRGHPDQTRKISEMLKVALLKAHFYSLNTFLPINYRSDPDHSPLILWGCEVQCCAVQSGAVHNFAKVHSTLGIKICQL